MIHKQKIAEFLLSMGIYFEGGHRGWCVRDSTRSQVLPSGFKEDGDVFVITAKKK